MTSSMTRLVVAVFATASLVGLSACGGGGGDSGGSSQSSSSQSATPTMTLVSSNPANNATAVDRSIAPALTFSAPINTSTVSGNVILKQANQTVPTTVTTVGSTVTISPASQLLPLTKYTITAGTGLQNNDGDSLYAATDVSFITRDGQWQAAELVETNDTGSAAKPKIAVDPLGNFLAVWMQSDGTRYNVWGNRYVTGSGWGTSVLIETDNAGDADSSSVAIDTVGNAMAIWRQSDGTRYNIWARRYVMGGGWGVVAMIETDNAGDAQDPQIVVDAAGNAIAVWTQSDGARYNIWANRYSVSGGWGTATLIETDNAGSALSPRIAIETTGNAIAVWNQWDGMRYNIWANSHVVGSGWGAAMLAESVDKSFDAPAIAIDTAGNALAVWVESASKSYVWANRYTPGSGWGTPATITAVPSDGSIAPPKVAIDISGNGLVVWGQYESTVTNIWANLYSTANGWGTAVPVETTTSNPWSPSLGFDAAGNALVLWQGTGWGMSRYMAGQGWISSSTALVSAAAGFIVGDMAIDSAGNALVVWTRNDNSSILRSSVWSSRFQFQ